jgi:hypothetical protein
MRKWISALIHFSLLLSFIPQNASAAVKPGSACSKVGSTSTVSNKKYTCIKSGKKIVWDKGQLVNKTIAPATTNSSTQEKPTLPAASNPGSTTEAASTKSEVKYKKEGEVCVPESGDLIGLSRNGKFAHLMCNGYDSRYIPRPKDMGAYDIDPITGQQLSGPQKLSFEPASNTPNTSTNSASATKKTYSSPQVFGKVNINNLIPDQVYGRSRQEIWDVISKSDYGLDALNFNTGPSLDAAKLEIEKNTLTNAAKLWSGIFRPSKKVEVILYEYPDVQWAQDTFKRITVTGNLFSAQFCKPDYCAAGSGNQVGNAPFVYEQGLTGGDDRNRSTSAHEYTHIVQTYGTTDSWRSSPLWLVEGMAQFYGEAIGYAPFDVNHETRNFMHYGNAFNTKRLYGIDLKEEFGRNSDAITQKWMERIEFPVDRFSQESAGLAYLVGGYATEVLVAVYGQDLVAKYITTFNKQGNWEQTFKEVFGIYKTDFYKKLTPYFFEMSKEL